MKRRRIQKKVREKKEMDKLQIKYDVNELQEYHQSVMKLCQIGNFIASKLKVENYTCLILKMPLILYNWFPIVTCLLTQYGLL